MLINTSTNMKSNYLLPLSILLVSCFLTIMACEKDDDTSTSGIDCSGSNPSYTMDIKPIIDNTCALSGCHVTGFVQGDFTTYDGLKTRADSGALLERVVTKKEMPPANSAGPVELTESQIKLFNCWIEDGAPNN